MTNNEEQQTAHETDNAMSNTSIRTISQVLALITAMVLLIKIAVDMGELKGTIQATLTAHQQEIIRTREDLNKLDIRIPPLEKHMHESYEERAKNGEGPLDGLSSKKPH